MICGVDVSLNSLDVRIGHQGPAACFANTPEGIAALAEFCQAQQVHLVAMEATWGYEKQPFALLWARAIPVAILNPRAVRDFAKSMGFLEKTDAIDAGVIACFAETKKCVACHPASAEQQRLKALVIRLRQLTDLRTTQRNQRRLVTEATVLDSFSQALTFLGTHSGAMEVAIAQMLAVDPLWRKLDESFRTIKGVADCTVARLMAELPEIGMLSNKKIGKLAGVAPLACDSGKTQGKRPVRGGRRSIRDILFVVAGVVGRYHPDLSPSASAWFERASRKKLSALPWRTSCWCGSMRRPARCANNLPLLSLALL